eukprot:scaffold2470_cov340-Prasinococcus_capsulatus_cf.AAC.5
MASRRSSACEHTVPRRRHRCCRTPMCTIPECLSERVHSVGQCIRQGEPVHVPAARTQPAPGKA